MCVVLLEHRGRQFEGFARNWPCTSSATAAVIMIASNLIVAWERFCVKWRYKSNEDKAAAMMAFAREGVQHRPPYDENL